MALLIKRSVLFPLMLMAAAAMLVLAGCSGTASTLKSETTYTQSGNGVVLTITLEAEGDSLLRETTESVLEYELNGFADKDAAQKALEELMLDFDTFEGMTHSIEYGDTSATELVVIDYSAISSADLAELNGLPADDDIDSSDVSLKLRVDQLEAGGFIEAE